MDMTRFATRHFIRDIILVFGLLSVIVIGAVAFFAAGARQEISQQYIDHAAAGAVRQFAGMADAMNQALELAGDWIASGRISLADMDGLNGLLFPVLKRDRILFGISVANMQGDSYYLSAHEDGWRTGETRGAGANRRTTVRLWDADQRELSADEKPATYDARSRPWFSPAISAEGVYWTQPYTFSGRKEVGITASISRPAQNGKPIVVAFDILLDDLFREIQRLGPSENSRVLIFRNDARLYVPDDDAGSDDFRSLAQVEDLLAKKMMAYWEGGYPRHTEAFSIVHDQVEWWCGFHPMENASRNVWVGIMVPEADIIGNAKDRQAGLWAVGGALILLSGGLVGWLIRRYRQSVERPEEQFDNRDAQASLQRLIDSGEGRTIEFKSTMRMNLHTQKTGKEIEIAWLKAVAGFMNTDGGTLLLGVADDGEMVGLAADKFANEDKCRLHFKNLINQHIGAEFSKYLQFDLVTINDRQVGVVSCSRSSEPVYLKTGKSEEFYIRSGPSSDALPVSKVVAYINNRR
jgi:hypothetical protein